MSTEADPWVSIIKRLEKATGGARELDARIFCALRGVPYERHSVGQAGRTTVNSFWDACEPYTSSLDAALMLVPAGASVQTMLDGKGIKRPWSMVHVHRNGPPYDKSFGDFAASLPIALCIAALRARRSLSQAQDGGEKE